MKTKRLKVPSVGTELLNLVEGGKVRARATVVEGGFRYKGRVFPTLSAAAHAACADLGVKGQGGWEFWGLTEESAKRRARWLAGDGDGGTRPMPSASRAAAAPRVGEDGRITLGASLDRAAAAMDSAAAHLGEVASALRAAAAAPVEPKRPDEQAVKAAMAVLEAAGQRQ